MPYEKKTYEPPSICWDCKNAVPHGGYGCSWSRRFQPIPGWIAKPSLIRNGKDKTLTKERNTRSYRVKECPLFIPDDEKPKTVVEDDI